MIKGVLIGNPVEKSISHITHNAIFKEAGINAVYEKRQTGAHELAAVKREGYDFLAVTMPLKEAVIPFLDEGGGGPVNTILVRKGRWIGYNFDGIGCLNAIERRESVRGKEVLVLGAGGAAKGAIAEAVFRGAHVFVWNRTYEKALGLGVQVLKEIDRSFPIIIQATSVGMLAEGLPIDLKWIAPRSLVMEMVYNPAYTMLVRGAIQRGARIVFGWEMFAELTALQMQLVFGERIDKELVFREIKKIFT